MNFTYFYNTKETCQGAVQCRMQSLTQDRIPHAMWTLDTKVPSSFYNSNTYLPRATNVTVSRSRCVSLLSMRALPYTLCHRRDDERDQCFAIKLFSQQIVAQYNGGRQKILVKQK